MRLAPWSSSLLTLALGCQQFTVDKPPEDPPAPPPVCEWTPPPTETRPANPLCAPVEEPPGGFRPIIEWGARGNANCTSLPVVGDIDLDGEPEVIANFTGLLPGTTAVVVLGDALTGDVSPLLIPVSLCTGALGVAGLVRETRLYRRDR